MRVTQSMLSNNTLRNLSNTYSKLSKLNEQINTQKKFSKPSDDPVAAMNAMGYRTELNNIQQFQDNISTVESWTDSTDDALNGVVDVLRKIRELTVEASNGTLEETQRSYIADEIEQLKNEIISLGDTQVGGKYIFGGNQTDKKPSEMNYSGTGEINLEVFTGIKLPLNIQGSDIFPDLVGTPEVVATDGVTLSPDAQVPGATGTITVTGTYSGTDDSTLQVKYDKDNAKWSYNNGEGWSDFSNTVTVDGISIDVSGYDVSGATDSGIFSLELKAAKDEKTGVVSDLIKTLKNGGSEEDIAAFLTKIDTEMDKILGKRSMVGARQNRVELMSDRLSNQEVFSTRILSDNEDVDLERVAIDLTTQESVLRAALSTGASIIQPTLMDFLR